jgi:integrase
MSTLPVPQPPTPVSPDLAHLAERATAYAAAATSENTRRAYRAAWADFAGWCLERQLEALPASEATVGLFLADRAPTLKNASLRMRLVAITRVHRARGLHLDTKAPQIRDVLQGIARTHGTAVSKKAPATLDVVRDAVRALAKEDTLRSLRDRAILLLGFAAALRRSEISAIDVGHIRFTAEGLILTLPRRKTDQEGAGTEIGVPFGQDAHYCPVRTVKAWMEGAAIGGGPLFRSISRADRPKAPRLSDRDVARVIQSAVKRAGYDPQEFGGHSLRAGFATAAGRAGVPERLIMLQTGHKSLPVLRGYIRRGSLFTDNAAAILGL